MTHQDISTLSPAEKRALLAKKLRGTRADDAPRSAPLSLAQQRLWFIDQMQPGDSVYTITAALRLTGALDRDRLFAALDRIRARHESLRTRFADEGGAPVQIVEPPAPLDREEHDLAQTPDALTDALAAFVGRPFDLSSGPLVRCALFRTGTDEHVLAFAAHHIIADYRSLQVMIGELIALYQDTGAPLPPVPIQYADHALAQRRKATEMERQIAHWTDTLAGLPPLLDLPTDRPRPARQSFAGARHRFALPSGLNDKVGALAKAENTTPFVILLAAFHALHRRYSGQDDICIGTTVSNRDRAEVQNIVGLFVNTLALRVAVRDDDSFTSLVRRLRGVVLDAMAHQDVPFEAVVDAATTERSLAHTPIFQSMFNLHEKQPDLRRLPGLEIAPLPMAGRSARFDLCLDLFRGDSLTGVLEYATDLFRPETAARLATDYARILETALAAPDQPLAGIDLATEDDRATVAALNDTARPLPGDTLAPLLAESAARNASRTALIAGDTTLTHAELDARANRLAACLADRLPAGARVAICLPRGADLVTALLASLKLGAVYIPLDPTHPPQRLAGILDEADPALVICDGSCPEGWDARAFDMSAERDRIAAAPDTPQAREIRGDDLAYIIFTSGTTGRPKGVPIRQKSLVNLLASMADRPGMGAEDTLVAVTTPGFDIAALELFLPLLCGGTLVVADPYDVLDGHALARVIARSSATMMQATPATWRLLTEEGWTAPEGFRMLCGGEALDLALARTLLEGQGELWNLYGPTETTIWSAVARITPEDCAQGLIPLGSPVANTTLHVLDPAGRTCPPGVAGELCIGGIGLSPGYLDRDALTADRFVTSDHGRLYRTGDRVRRLADGRLAYLGRMDFQVKLRGFRVELGEIESLLAKVPGVEQAVVALVGEGEQAALVAYLRAEAQEARLRDHLARHLPGYMIPAAFVFVDSFPLNPNGKVDRRRLPDPRLGAPEGNEPPVTGTEHLLSTIWAELLSAPAPGRRADFFALGGHSLLAMRMIARLPHDGPRAVPLRLLFEHPRLADFAVALDRAGILRDTPPPPIPRLPADAPRPLSPAQERQWTLATLDPGQSAYCIPAAIRLSGPVEADRLARAFALLCSRHEVLRSRYPSQQGRPSVVVAESGGEDFAVESLTSDAIPERLRTEAARPFDLESGPLVRLRLYSAAAEDHVLFLALHHIAGDAWSVQLMLRELMQHYTALAGDAAYRPAPLPLQYTDFAAWQRGQDHAPLIRFWTELLEGAPPLLDMPTDFPRPARQDHAGGAVDVTLDRETGAALRTLAAETGATPFMAFLALYTALLGRYAMTDDVVVGIPVSQRPHPDLETLAGMFVNTLPLRLGTGGDAGFRTHLAACRDRVMSGFEHQDVPFEQVVEALSPERSWSHNPVFQTMFVWKTQDGATLREGGDLSWSPVQLDTPGSKMDLTMAVLDRGDGFDLRFEYRRDLFRPETIMHMARAFEALAASAVSAPEGAVRGLPVLHTDQARQIEAWNDTGTPEGDTPQTLHALVSARAALSPDATAVRDATGSLTYAALEALSDRLAERLRAAGIGPGARAGIALPRGVDMIAAILAVLKSGAAYVPLDANYPPERIAYIREDARLALVIETLDDIETLSPGSVDPGAASEDGLAYLIYTSGSTGRPKGVALAHRNAVAMVNWARSAFEPERLRGVLASTSICFDLSVFEIFLTLSSGGTLLVVDDLFGLPDSPFRDEVTLINTVPTPMAELLRLGPLPASVTTVCLAGEALSPALAESVLAEPQVDALWNLYGPSEDTTYSTGRRIEPGGSVNIGWPITGTQAHVLDDCGQPVAPGMPGELYLSGAGVGLGYWNRPDLTAERFLPNPFDRDGSAPRMYRTGDRVRRAADGSLDYLGRADRQVKIRGFRVEPGEIEAVLSEMPGLGSVAVDARTGHGDHARLTAWVEGTLPEAAIRTWLSDRLPAYLVPTQIVVMDELPRLPNGKLDRNALPEPQAAAMDTPQALARPMTPLEERLSGIWRQVLGGETVLPEQNFFAIGGDSILAIQVVAIAREDGIPLSPRDLFVHSTVAELARAAETRPGLGRASGPVTGPQSLTPIQRWFFARDLPQRAHWNQALVLEPVRPLDPEHLERALTMLSDRHDALRARFHERPDGWQQTYADPGEPTPFTHSTDPVTKAATAMQAGFDLETGPLWGAVLCDTADGGQRLAVAAHHLLVDGVSWRILLGDLERLYMALEAGTEPQPLRRGTPPGAWADLLASHNGLAAEAAFWRNLPDAPPLPLDRPDSHGTEADTIRVEANLDPALTAQLLDEVPAAYPVTAQELMVAALCLTLRDWTGEDRTLIEMESHGRPDLSDAVDIAGTVGWFTGLFPVAFDTVDDPDETLRRVKDTLRAIPNDGIGFGVLRQLTGDLDRTPGAQIRFNYLGQAGALFGPDSLFRAAPESAGPTIGAQNPRDVAVEINALAAPGGLRITWNVSETQISRATAHSLATAFAARIETLTAHCLGGGDIGYSPSDFPDMDFGQDDLDDLLRSL